MPKCIKIKIYVISCAPKNIFQSSFNINGFIMEYVTEFNFLGLILDSTGTGRHITILLMSK